MRDIFSFTFNAKSGKLMVTQGDVNGIEKMMNAGVADWSLRAEVNPELVGAVGVKEMEAMFMERLGGLEMELDALELEKNRQLFVGEDTARPGVVWAL